MVTRAARPGLADDPAGEHEHLQLTTLAGWRGFVTEMPAVPDLLPEPVWTGLADGTRGCYDDDRIDHHSRLLVVQTPTIRQVINSGRRLIQLNKNTHYGRCGLMVSGPARTGKTTALTQLGKTIEVIHRRRHPRSGSSDIPVIYITVPPAATPKMIAMEFARFLGLPLSHRANITDIADAVCGVSLDAQVTLVAVDELHNLNTATRAGAEASDTLKYFTERIPATFVYAGISLDRAGLLSGTRGEQIAGRFGIVRTGPFGHDQQWTALIAALEDSLRLHRHRPGTLPGLGRYLHQRTHGMIGSLLWLIRSAAIGAVLDGTEKITKKPWTTSKPTSPPKPRARPPREQGRCCPPTESGRFWPCTRPGCQCAPSPDSSATAPKPSATTCTGARHPESEPSRGRTCSPTCSPTTAASGSPRTRTCPPAPCSPNSPNSASREVRGPSTAG